MERRRPIRFFNYRIPSGDGLWLAENTRVEEVRGDGDHVLVVLSETGEEQDWEPPPPPDPELEVA